VIIETFRQDRTQISLTGFGIPAKWCINYGYACIAQLSSTKKYFLLFKIVACGVGSGIFILISLVTEGIHKFILPRKPKT
jgi:hypothetical protein